MGGDSRRSEAAHATIILSREIRGIRGLFRLIYVKVCWTHYTSPSNRAMHGSRRSDFRIILCLVLRFPITATYAGGLPFRCTFYLNVPTGPWGAGGAASSALSLGLNGVPAPPAASILASEAAALGAYIAVIRKRST